MWYPITLHRPHLTTPYTPASLVLLHGWDNPECRKHHISLESLCLLLLSLCQGVKGPLTSHLLSETLSDPTVISHLSFLCSYTALFIYSCTWVANFSWHPECARHQGHKIKDVALLSKSSQSSQGESLVNGWLSANAISAINDRPSGSQEGQLTQGWKWRGQLREGVAGWADLSYTWFKTMWFFLKPAWTETRVF